MVAPAARCRAVRPARPGDPRRAAARLADRPRARPPVDVRNASRGLSARSPSRSHLSSCFTGRSGSRSSFCSCSGSRRSCSAGALSVPNSLRSGDGTPWLSPGSCSECSSGTLPRERSQETRRSTSRASGSSSSSAPLTPWRLDELAGGGLHPGYAFPLWHAFLAAVTEVAARRSDARRRARNVGARPDRRPRRVRGGSRPLPLAVARSGHRCRAGDVHRVCHPATAACYPLLTRPAPSARQFAGPGAADARLHVHA